MALSTTLVFRPLCRLFRPSSCDDAVEGDGSFAFRSTAGGSGCKFSYPRGDVAWSYVEFGTSRFENRRGRRLEMKQGCLNNLQYCVFSFAQIEVCITTGDDLR